MPTFAFEARDKSGQSINGVREAPDQQTALLTLRQDGFFVTELSPSRQTARHAATTLPQVMPQAATPADPTKVPALAEGYVPNAPASAPGAPRPVAPAGSVPPVNLPTQIAPPGGRKLTGRASARDVSLYFRQMHAMLHAGTSLAHALNTLGQHAANKALREASAQMSRELLKGQQWSETMRAYPGLFSELMIGMVTAGEKGGFLDRMCLRLAEYSERDYELQQTIKRETWYPKLLVVCSFIIPSVVPLVLQGFGAWLGNILPPAIMIGSAFVIWKMMSYVSPLVFQDNPVRRTLDWIKLLIPLVSKIVRGLATAKFCRALGALYSSGMGIQMALDVSARTCGNAEIATRVQKVVPLVMGGQTLTQALGTTGVFNGIALQMLSTGETTGNLDEQLSKVADFLEADAETAIRQAVKVLGIVVFLAIAAMVGIQVVQFWSGYFNGVMTEGEKLSQ